MGFVILKFGGTSVASAQRWSVIAGRIRASLTEGLVPVVVCSAVAGVSDALEALLDGCVASDGGWRAGLERVGRVHDRLAEALDVDAATLLAQERGDLERLLHGADLVGEVPAGLRAKVMACGELMSTRLGAAWLREREGLDVAWVDARTLLEAERDPRAGDERNVLSATCSDAFEPTLGARLPRTRAVVTQGFIAGLEADGSAGTALLGRGGSDTSAAYLAAALGAERCEIWTDVPGMFTANPRQVPEARLLRRLDYDEALEIASAGARVLHPRALAPLRKHGIPMHVRSTLRPDEPGTVVSAGFSDTTPRLKAIAARQGLTLIDMQTPRMWQQVGFLADAFACFKARGLSVDLVSTSETHVTASLDPSANALNPEAIAGLLEDLQPVCQARAIGPCASVTLVGRHIRAILHQLGPALQVFEERKVHLVSQAASDLNVTFVVDDEEADRLVARLHALLLARGTGDSLLGPTAAELESADEGGAEPAPPATSSGADGRWWRRRRRALLEIADAEGTPAYVYDLAEVERAARALLDHAGADRVLYAMKANPHPEILRLLADAGLGLECVSPGELARVFSTLPDLDPDRVLFTPNFAARQEYAEALALGVRVTLDNLHPLRAWPELFEGRSLFVRVDPGRGRGHHAHVRTAGALSKFGVAPSELEELRARAAAAGATIVGLHAHSGSGIRTAGAWSDVGAFLAQVAEGFPDVRVLDVGGGLGVPEKPGDRPLDLEALGRALAGARAARPGVEVWIEPGRYLVAGAGVLLARVTQTKRKGEVRFVGVDAGMNTLVRPAMYGAFHEIANLTRLGEPATDVVNIVGPICESGDTLGHERPMPTTEEGDVLVIATAGAYGRSMSSGYNLRPLPIERTLAPGFQ